MWLAFRFVFGAVLGYVFALVFIFGVIIFGGAFLVGFLSAPQHPPYHTTKATRS